MFIINSIDSIISSFYILSNVVKMHLWIVQTGAQCCYQYITSIKQPRFGNFKKFLSIVNMEISSPGSDLAPKF